MAQLPFRIPKRFVVVIANSGFLNLKNPVMKK